jgi:hypothetical protein
MTEAELRAQDETLTRLLDEFEDTLRAYGVKRVKVWDVEAVRQRLEAYIESLRSAHVEEGADRVLRGEDARRVLHEIEHGTPDTPERRETMARADAVYRTFGPQIIRSPELQAIIPLADQLRELIGNEDLDDDMLYDAAGSLLPCLCDALLRAGLATPCKCEPDRPHDPGCRYVASLKNSESLRGDAEWRRLLWLAHGCPVSALYGDDGEMSCGNCGVDFKRFTPAQIKEKWAEGPAIFRQRMWLAAAAGRAGAEHGRTLDEV